MLLPSSASMVLMTALYPSKNERELRIQGQGHIPNVFMKSDDRFPSARVFKTILCSAGNKKCLELIYSVGEECVSLSSGNNRGDLIFY